MKKIIWQIAKLFFLLFAISIITFLLMKLTPINPVSSYLGADSNVTQEQYDYLVKVWGLDQPSIVQYFNWVKGALTGNMGDSFIYNKPVSELISKAASNTFMLMLTSWKSHRPNNTKNIILICINAYFLVCYSYVDVFCS